MPTLKELIQRMEETDKTLKGNNLIISSPRSPLLAMTSGILSVLLYLCTPNLVWLQMLLTSLLSISLATLSLYLTPRIKLNSSLMKKSLIGFAPPLAVISYMLAVKGPVWWTILGTPTATYNLTFEGVVFCLTGIIITVLLSLSLPKITVVGVVMKNAKEREKILKKLKNFEFWVNN